MMWLFVFLALLCGPAAAEELRVSPSGFAFGDDTFAYENELRWEYHWDSETGKMRPQARQPPPTYSLRCVSMARAARQFSYHARFEPAEPKATPVFYRHWIRMVMSRDSRSPSAAAARVVIPGYASLREFSRDYETILKAASGGAWRSYVQRGNWRMIFPFRRAHQQQTAERLVQALRDDRLPLLHMVCFPSLAMNHTVMVFEVRRSNDDLEFLAYDPNNCDQPTTLRYDAAARQFYFVRTLYFAGGPVNVYEIYRNWCY